MYLTWIYFYYSIPIAFVNARDNIIVGARTKILSFDNVYGVSIIAHTVCQNPKSAEQSAKRRSASRKHTYAMGIGSGKVEVGGYVAEACPRKLVKHIES